MTDLEEFKNLADAITRLSRTQFKTNTLLESQGSQLSELLTTLESLRLENNNQARLEHHAVPGRQLDPQQAKIDLLIALLPVLDGVRTAIESGQALLSQQPQSPNRSLGSWFPFFRFQDKSSQIDQQWSGWVNGLILIQERFLQILEAERIRPTAFAGQPFDPSQHVAVELAPSEQNQNSGLPRITRVFSQGYVCEQPDAIRIIRFAEVAVAK